MADSRMADTRPMVTAAELLEMPDDGLRRELVRGAVHTVSPAGYRHGAVAGRLTASLLQIVQAHELGSIPTADTGFRLHADPDTVRAPDVAFVSRQRVEQVGEPEGYWPGAPDLVGEVISPSDTYTEVEEKVREYLHAGARMVIVLDPRTRSARVHRSGGGVEVLAENDRLDGGDVVPGWSVPLRELFG